MSRAPLFYSLLAMLAAGATGTAHELKSGSRPVSHGLNITGEVKAPARYSVKDLKALPSVSLKELAIVGKRGARVAKNIKGVPLKALLDPAGIITRHPGDSKKIYLVATATDGYKALFSWNEVFNSPLGEGILVVYEENGAPIPDSEGELLLVSAKDYMTGSRHVKWLASIDVRRIKD